jgi:valyl-tRNA synthetase
MVRVLEAVLRLAHPIIPFITEELWQKVAPLAASGGESIMVAPYPRADSSRIDEAAEAWFARLKELVLAPRNLRGEMAISPAQRVPLDVTCAPADILPYAPFMAALARLSEVRAVRDLTSSDAPVAVVGEWRLMLHIDVDPAAECQRVEKEVSRYEAELLRERGKLDNPDFVRRAPAEVVAAARSRVEVLDATLSKLRPRLEQLRRRAA